VAHPARPTNHRARYREIAETIAHHGLHFLLDAMDLQRRLPLRGALSPRDDDSHSAPERLRLVLEDLGAAFIKLGQILSTRADLLPEEYRFELAKLQDQAPEVPFEAIRDVIQAEFGRPLDELFADFDPEPLAAASIGQAHAATLFDGTEVVVKVRRPGVVEQVEQDLEILHNLAATASRRWQLADDYDAVGLAQEFAQTLRAELDYIREGRSAERFAASFAEDPSIHIPRVFWNTSSSRVLTLERIHGIKIDDLSSLDAAGIDRRRLAERAAQIILKMVFEYGFFHADPHAGNFFIEADGRIGVIEFGMVGTVDKQTQEHLISLLLAVASQDPEDLVDALLELGVAGRRLDRTLLRRDLEHLLSRYYGRALGELELAPILGDTFTVIRRHHLRLPPNLALLLKTLAMDEAVGSRLDPSFRLPSVMAPFAERLLRRQYSPFFWARRLGRTTLEAARLGSDLPRHLKRILGDLERGSIEVGVRPEGFEPVAQRFERLANRIVVGIVTAAFINGLAVLLSVYQPTGSERWVGLVFATGFVFAGMLGGYLAWTILRSSRSHA
jgi:ubiquinone biosynthesis protein